MFIILFFSSVSGVLRIFFSSVLFKSCSSLISVDLKFIKGYLSFILYSNRIRENLETRESCLKLLSVNLLNLKFIYSRVWSSSKVSILELGD